MSLSTYRWQHSFQKLQFEIYRLQLKCVPLEDSFRTKPGVKSIQVRSVRLRKEPDDTDLYHV